MWFETDRIITLSRLSDHANVFSLIRLFLHFDQAQASFKILVVIAIVFVLTPDQPQPSINL